MNESIDKHNPSQKKIETDETLDNLSKFRSRPQNSFSFLSIFITLCKEEVIPLNRKLTRTQESVIVLLLAGVLLLRALCSIEIP